MSELVIETRSFELAKNRLKEFSQKTTETLELDTVRTSGGFLGLGDHKVTGHELNSRLSTVQKHLIDLNEMNNQTIKEFGQVYSALEALDKDYIQAILISIKATEKTSERIQDTQTQINKIVDDQKRTLEILKKFKQKLDNYAHLEDIDNIWMDHQNLNEKNVTLTNMVNSATEISKTNAQKIDDLQMALKIADKKLDDLSKHLNQQIVILEAIIAFTSNLEKNVHLQDIDEMWNSLLNVRSTLTICNNELILLKDLSSRHQTDIETLLLFMGKLSEYEHLNDIDDIWNSSELHARQLLDLEKQSVETKKSVLANKENTDAAVRAVINEHDTAVQILSNKIKYAYILAGSSFGLAVVELIVILFKVI